MSDERIKIIFKRVYVTNDGDWFGSGEFYFIASVAGQTVGDRRRIFDAVEGRWIPLPQSEWSTVVDLHGKSEIVVRFQAKDEDVFFDDDMGTVQHTLRPPWREGEFRARLENFTLEWRAELSLDGTFERITPGHIAACRQEPGSATCTTADTVDVPARLELHPVTPPPPENTFPPRPPFTQIYMGVRNRALLDITSAIPASAPLNVIPNAPAIPILTAAEASDRTCARIEFTYYCPHHWQFTDADPRLEWSVNQLGTGAAVAFLNNQNKGLKVMVYGTAAGEAALEVRLNGQLLASYRALILPLKKIPCRFNILRGTTPALRPRSSPEHIRDHLAIANRFLRQMALELELDTDATLTSPVAGDPLATPSSIPGIFFIDVPDNVTANIASSGFNRATRLNYRPGVMNFAYLVSEEPRTPNEPSSVLGAASDYPASTTAVSAGVTRPRVSDSGTPSTSWVRPSGVPPGLAAGTINMDLIGGRVRPGSLSHLYAMYVCNLCGDPVNNAGTYGGVIAHEFGHILNLGHRVEMPDPGDPSGLAAGGVYWDGLNYPPSENVMHWSAERVSVDFDVIQTRGARSSPLIPP